MNKKRKTPYPYQKIAISKTVHALKNKAKALVVMATGLGKTITSCFTVEKFLKKPSDRVLFLCHGKGILSQNKQEYIDFFGNDYTYADFFGSKKNWDADKHNFVFATFQSLHSHLLKSNRKNIFSPKHFDYIVVDESHHAKAETFDEVLDYFKPVWELGITATPDREDQLDIRDRFGKEVVNYPLPEALGKGWLTKVVYKIMSDGIDQETIEALVQEVLVENVRMTEKQLNERLFIKKRTEEQVKGILSETAGGKKAIIFCANITHLKHVAELIPNSAVINSSESDFDNDQALKDYISGKVQHILVVDKFNEGMNVPDTDVLVFLRATDSYRIWLQQLGRGLRKFPGKEIVTVLDFVGNIQRIQDLKTLFTEISSFSGGNRKNLSDELVLHEALHVDGDHFSFDFTSEIVDLLKIVDIIGLDYYETWQEASEAAIALGIKTMGEYLKQYTKNPRLHSSPSMRYHDFPGFEIFLGKDKKESYETWQEASEAAIKLGIKTMTEYEERYREDPKLVFKPRQKYANLPNSYIFLGQKVPDKKYITWQEASEAAIKLGIKNSIEYQKRYTEDPRLPSTPVKKYHDFPGDPIFFGRQIPAEKYSTWQEASEAAIALGIKTGVEYSERYSIDPKLPSSPYMYPDFPGFDIFLGKEIKSLYLTWQEASEAAITLGIKSWPEYKKRRDEDPRLPSSPSMKYADFPGFKVFLGGQNKDYYPTWQEASEAAIKLGIKNSIEYQKRYTEDPRLHGRPDKFYSNFPGYSTFLRNKN